MAVETGIGHGGQLLAGLSLYAVATKTSYQNTTLGKDYPDDHILYLYTLFFVAAFVAFLFYLCLPTRQFDDCIAKRDVSIKLRFIDQTVSTLRCGLSPRMLLLIPASLYQGAFTVFFLAVYPTSFSFDTRLKEDPYLVAFYCVFIGVGVILAGVIISQLPKLIRNISLCPTMLIHFFVMVLLLFTLFSSTSILSLISETSGPLLRTEELIRKTHALERIQPPSIVYRTTALTTELPRHLPPSHLIVGPSVRSPCSSVSVIVVSRPPAESSANELFPEREWRPSR